VLPPQSSIARSCRSWCSVKRSAGAIQTNRKLGLVASMRKSLGNSSRASGTGCGSLMTGIRQADRGESVGHRVQRPVPEAHRGGLAAHGPFPGTAVGREIAGRAPGHAVDGLDCKGMVDGHDESARRAPARIAARLASARKHVDVDLPWRAGHRPPCHASGLTWLCAGEKGQGSGRPTPVLTIASRCQCRQAGLVTASVIPAQPRRVL